MDFELETKVPAETYIGIGLALAIAGLLIVFAARVGR